MIINLPIEITEFFKSVHSQGWTGLLVGGSVRDAISGSPVKDFDVEVYGASPDELIVFLSQFGEVNSVGKSFGVIKVRVGDIDLDVSVPRRENKSGHGHKGFIAEFDKTISPREAASRRDFTWNALAYNPVEDMIYDFFNGRKDIASKVIRHTSEAFSEDPLRVLRAFQFAGRFNMKIDQDTASLCKSLLNEYDTLAKERIFEEWLKWATKSVVPSAGLQVLVETGWISKYPAIQNLIGCQQSPKWHPEGDAWNHTLEVLDYIASKSHDPVHVLAALLHDVGKPATTHVKEDGSIGSSGHDIAGEVPAREFLESVGCPKQIADKVIMLVVTHMRWTSWRPEVSRKAVYRLLKELQSVGLTFQDWLLLVEADRMSRPQNTEHPMEVQEAIRIVESMDASNGFKSILMGRHLLERGLKPSPLFGDILREAELAQAEREFCNLPEAIEWLKRNLHRWA